jgi:hypothetical protein
VKPAKSFLIDTTGSPLDAIYIQITRLQLEVLQLHCNPNTDANNRRELIQLFWTASSLITSMEDFNNSMNIALYSPSYLGSSLSLAAFTLLRMLKSGIAQILEPAALQSGKLSIFAAIHLFKQMSLANNDIYAKASEYLSTMWINPSIFKIINHKKELTLRIRNRLFMSIVFDTILIWVEEYGACTYATPASRKQAKGMIQRQSKKS